MDSLGPLVVCGEYVLDVYLKQSYAVFSGEKPTRTSAIEQYLCIAVVDYTDLTWRPPPASARSTGRALMAASGWGARIRRDLNTVCKSLKNHLVYCTFPL